LVGKGKPIKTTSKRETHIKGEKPFVNKKKRLKKKRDPTR